MLMSALISKRKNFKMILVDDFDQTVKTIGYYDDKVCNNKSMDEEYKHLEN